MLLSPPFALGAAGQVLSGRLLRLAVGSAFRGAAAGVQGVSGALAGAPNTMGELTLPSNALLTVQPFRAVVQNTQDATGGQFILVNDAAVNLAVTAQHATQYRRSLVVAYAADSVSAGVASTAATDKAALELVDGALAASAGAAALPAAPANALALGELLIPPIGVPVTVTPYNPRTTARGGILPVVADGSGAIPGHDGVAGSHVGQYRDHPTRGLERWDGALWSPPQPHGWTLATLNGGIVNLPTSNNYSPLRWKVDRATNELHLVGLLDKANIGATSVISTLPPEARPSYGYVINCLNGATSTQQVDYYTDGRLQSKAVPTTWLWFNTVIPLD